MSLLHSFFSKRSSLAKSTGDDEAQILKEMHSEVSDRKMQETTGLKRSRCETTHLPAETYHIAVNGCCHGQLDTLYAACKAHEVESGQKIQLLICCGDFQAIRSEYDLESMAVPMKYREMGDFHKYYRWLSEKKLDNVNMNTEQKSGLLSSEASLYYKERRLTECNSEEPVIAPYLTVFIGGNHENSDWLAEESYGGFVAPNIYYLGHSGVIIVDGVIRIAGLSGIYNERDYYAPYPPRPYSQSEYGKRSAYHTRAIEVAKLFAYFNNNTITTATTAEATEEEGAKLSTSTSQFASPYVDIILSHDWPVNITKYGNESQLLRYKPFFSDDIAHGTLGNPETMKLLQLAKPSYWFAGHLHCRFEAHVKHPFCKSVAKSVESDEHSVQEHVCELKTLHINQLQVHQEQIAAEQTETVFLALDKCGKNKQHFVEFVNIPIHSVSNRISSDKMVNETTVFIEGSLRICRDERWVEILRASHPYVATNTVNFAFGKSNSEQQQQTLITNTVLSEQEFDNTDEMHNVKHSNYRTDCHNTSNTNYSNSSSVGSNSKIGAISLPTSQHCVLSGERDNNVNDDVKCRIDHIVHSPTTLALLQALHLQPAIPLQMPSHVYSQCENNNNNNNVSNNNNDNNNDNNLNKLYKPHVQTNDGNVVNDKIDALEWSEDVNATIT